MKTDLPVVLFCCSRKAPTLEMAYVIRATVLSAVSEGLRPVVVLGSEELKSQLAGNLFDGAVVLTCPQLLRPHSFVNRSRLLGLAARMFRAIRLNFFADLVLLHRNVLQGHKVFSALVSKYPIGVVAISDDRTLGWDFGVVCAAKKSGIPTLSIPFALSDPDADWLSRQNRPAFDPMAGTAFERAVKKRIGRLYPQNLRSKDDKEKMFLTAGQAAIVLYLKVGFSRPWAYGGGITDKSAVFGEADRLKQIRLGVPDDKLVVTGQCSMDSLCEARKNALQLREHLLAEGGWVAGHRIIVCAVPQYLEHGMLTAGKHWQLTEQMLIALTSTGSAVVLSLHPRSRLNDYRPLAERYKASISQRPLIEILAGADLFVATHSSTVRWAVLLRTPTIILDDFEMERSAMFANAGVRFVKARSELGKQARRMLEDQELRASIISEMDVCAGEIDPFDGQNASRIVSLLMSMTNEPTNELPHLRQRKG